MSGGFFFPMPPGFGGEVPQEAKDAMDRRAAEEKLRTRQLEDFLSRMTHDDIELLGGLFIQSARDSEQAMYLAGMLVGYQHKRDGSCLGCGKIHDDLGDAIHSILDKGKPIPQDQINKIDWDGSDKDGEVHVDEMVLLFTEKQYDKLCAEYRVNPIELDKDKPFHEMRVLCSGCGMQYPHLQDRMIKPPEECSGCMVKAAHG